MNQGSITGFMILKNVLSQGYPFAEAIASALPVCDELLLSDGYSTDGTYEILVKIANANRKVKLYQDAWTRARNFSTVLRKATNTLRRRVRGKYLLSLQANEVIHEDCVDFIRTLPEIMPRYVTFSFPFVQLLEKYIFREEFRIRFAKNVSFVEAVGDAWTLGLKRSFVLKLLIREPWRVFEYLGQGVRVRYSNTGNAEYSRIVPLPEPVFRYYSLFPWNFVEKMRKHIQTSREYDWKGVEEFVCKIGTADLTSVDRDAFWQEALKVLVEFTRQFEQLPRRCRPLPIMNRDKHPLIMRYFVDNPVVTKYDIRPEVLDTIRGL
jgi:glycosyltransferase involved in cell wall biosynthesis